jgi:toxin ParE1/3/4
VNVRWSRRAQRDLEAIYAYIALDSPTAAAGVIERLLARGEDLGSFPESGRSIPALASKRGREIIEPPYRIIYYPRVSGIEIAGVFHSARKAPWERRR